ncbi:MAG: hypothetical protein HQL30_02990 [Candidatus Omnitrophica bacterium]|nr:hypothetical protein [Candidatus Omnitrophota bacterium]
MFSVKYPAAFLLMAFLIIPDNVFAAVLNDLYRPILPQKMFLYSGKTRLLSTDEDGIHGLDPFGKFDSRPLTVDTTNRLSASIMDNWEISFSSSEYLPAHYSRKTYSTNSSLNITQEYDLDSFRDYSIGSRVRVNNCLELFGSVGARWGKTNWDLYSSTTTRFAHILSRYSYADLGARYLSDGGNNDPGKNLSLVFRPLLCPGQVNVETGISADRGTIDREYYYYTNGGGSTFYYEFDHRLKPSFNTYARIRTGVGGDMEMGSGIKFRTPLIYRYTYKLKTVSTGLMSSVSGEYSQFNDFTVPLDMVYRNSERFETRISADTRVTVQRLKYRSGATTGVITGYPQKDLTALSSNPRADFFYLLGDCTAAKREKFDLIARPGLAKGQLLLNAGSEMDLAAIMRDTDHDTLNLIDPYSVFSGPLDYFSPGNEQYAFFLGNTSNYAANVLPQNYWKYYFGGRYGLSKGEEIRVNMGFSSPSSLEHYTLNDLKKRWYRFCPGYFYEFGYDMRLSDRASFSVRSRYVPEYATFLIIEGDQRQYSSLTEYLDVALSLDIQF